ncbi:hypothetical protein H632_c1102p2 [Helicosporidium sp. ATCC 50920]|nr:hypothetical protein H632_c1102p2 [Helicosporidium sp. ATCC 50920]|eukprot:KDD74742.1 hypothetical protein H632_c1102p2 [Helicosporidium sp. ATCC 50920]
MVLVETRPRYASEQQDLRRRTFAAHEEGYGPTLVRYVDRRDAEDRYLDRRDVETRYLDRRDEEDRYLDRRDAEDRYSERRAAVEDDLSEYRRRRHDGAGPVSHYGAPARFVTRPKAQDAYAADEWRARRSGSAERAPPRRARQEEEWWQEDRRNDLVGGDVPPRLLGEDSSNVKITFQA